MLSPAIINFHTFPVSKPISLFFTKHERQILKALLLGSLNQLFWELFTRQLKRQSLKESYSMDSKIIQFLIEEIIATGEYTLEGIAYYTRIPFDVIYDAASGITTQFSITPWSRIVALYLEVKPEVGKAMSEKLLQIKSQNKRAFSLLLNEE